MNPATQSLVLIVDDDESIRESLTVVFDTRGLLCMAVPDGESAMEVVREGPCPAVAIVAFHLPEATGAETSRCLKLLCPQLSIIGTSTEHARRDEMIRAGAELFFEKPFDLNLLIGAVTKHFTSISSA